MKHTDYACLGTFLLGVAIGALVAYSSNLSWPSVAVLSAGLTFCYFICMFKAWRECRREIERIKATQDVIE